MSQLRNFYKYEEGIRKRRRGGDKSSGVETVRARGKIDGGVCLNIQENSKREQI